MHHDVLATQILTYTKHANTHTHKACKYSHTQRRCALVSVQIVPYPKIELYVKPGLTLARAHDTNRQDRKKLTEAIIQTPLNKIHYNFSEKYGTLYVRGYKMIHLTWPNESNDILLWYSATNWALCNWSLLSWGFSINNNCHVQHHLERKATSFQEKHIHIPNLHWEQQEGCTIYVIYANWGCGEKPTGGNYIDCEDQTEKNQSCRFAKQYWTEIHISLPFYAGSQKWKSHKLVK